MTPPSVPAPPAPLAPPVPATPPPAALVPLRPPLAPPLPGWPPALVAPPTPPEPLRAPVPGWPPALGTPASALRPPLLLAPPLPGWPPELPPPVPIPPPEPCTPPFPGFPPSPVLPPPSDPPVPVELVGVSDEQAAPAMASAATVVRKKWLDVMRSSALEIWTAGICRGATPRLRGERPRVWDRSRCDMQWQRRLKSVWHLTKPLDWDVGGGAFAG